MFLLICNIAESVTIAFGDLNEAIYGMEWHLCPTELQKYFVLMTAITHRPVIMKGLFSLNSSRMTFKRVNWFKKIIAFFWYSPVIEYLAFWTLLGCEYWVHHFYGSQKFQIDDNTMISHIYYKGTAETK